MFLYILQSLKLFFRPTHKASFSHCVQLYLICYQLIVNKNGFRMRSIKAADIVLRIWGQLFLRVVSTQGRLVRDTRETFWSPARVKWGTSFMIRSSIATLRTVSRNSCRRKNCPHNRRCHRDIPFHTRFSLDTPPSYSETSRGSACIALRVEWTKLEHVIFDVFIYFKYFLTCSRFGGGRAAAIDAAYTAAYTAGSTAGNTAGNTVVSSTAAAAGSITWGCAAVASIAQDAVESNQQNKQKEQETHFGTRTQWDHEISGGTVSRPWND